MLTAVTITAPKYYQGVSTSIYTGQPSWSSSRFHQRGFEMGFLCNHGRSEPILNPI